jgi:NitT/TauT family transport system permease protein
VLHQIPFLLTYRAVTIGAASETVNVTQPQSAAAPRRRRILGGARPSVGDVGYPLVAFALLLAAWELWVRLGHEPPYIMVPFTSVIGACFDHWGVLLHNTRVTVVESVYGFAIGAGVGIALAFLLTRVRAASKGLFPLIIVYHVIPTIALAPLFSIWFGFGVLPKVLIVANLSFFPVLLNTMIGLRSTQPLQVSLFRSAGAGPFSTFFRLRLPNALPQVFVGLKIASTLALIGAVIAEFVSAGAGLGEYVLVANGNLDTKHLMVGVIYLSVTGLLFFGAVQVAEWLLTPWHVSQRASPAA